MDDGEDHALCPSRFSDFQTLRWIVNQNIHLKINTDLQILNLGFGVFV